MRRVRLLMAAVPPMLSDILRALSAREAGLELIGEVGPNEDLRVAARAAGADVVIIGAGRPPPAPDELQSVDGPTRVLTLTDGGRIGYLDRMVAHRTVLADLSPEELIEAVLGESGSDPAADADTTCPQPEEGFPCRSP